MSRIPVPICRFSDNNFKRLYLKKEKLFLEFFFGFLKLAWNLQHSKKKEEYPRLIITEIIASERDVYLIVSMVLLQHTIR